MKELMPDAEFHMISLRDWTIPSCLEVKYDSDYKQVPAKYAQCAKYMPKNPRNMQKKIANLCKNILTIWFQYAKHARETLLMLNCGFKSDESSSLAANFKLNPAPASRARRGGPPASAGGLGPQ